MEHRPFNPDLLITAKDFEFQSARRNRAEGGEGMRDASDRRGASRLGTYRADSMHWNAPADATARAPWGILNAPKTSYGSSMMAGRSCQSHED